MLGRIGRGQNYIGVRIPPTQPVHLGNGAVPKLVRPRLTTSDFRRGSLLERLRRPFSSSANSHSVCWHHTRRSRPSNSRTSAKRMAEDRCGGLTSGDLELLVAALYITFWPWS